MGTMSQPLATTLAVMTPAEAATILRQFNEWRRGNEDLPQFDPREIGEAIDAAVEMIDRLEAAEKERVALLALVAEWKTLAKESAIGRDCAHTAVIDLARQAKTLQAERDHARACHERTVRILTDIHALLYPPRFTDHNGRTRQFKSPLAEDQMQELSDRIRALPDEIARSVLEESK